MHEQFRCTYRLRLLLIPVVQDCKCDVLNLAFSEVMYWLYTSNFTTVFWTASQRVFHRCSHLELVWTFNVVTSNVVDYGWLHWLAPPPADCCFEPVPTRATEQCTSTNSVSRDRLTELGQFFVARITTRWIVTQTEIELPRARFIALASKYILPCANVHVHDCSVSAFVVHLVSQFSFRESSGVFEFQL